MLPVRRGNEGIVGDPTLNCMDFLRLSSAGWEDPLGPSRKLNELPGRRDTRSSSCPCAEFVDLVGGWGDCDGILKKVAVSTACSSVSHSVFVDEAQSERSNRSKAPEMGINGMSLVYF